MLILEKINCYMKSLLHLNISPWTLSAAHFQNVIIGNQCVVSVFKDIKLFFSTESLCKAF